MLGLQINIEINDTNIYDIVGSTSYKWCGNPIGHVFDIVSK